MLLQDSRDSSLNKKELLEDKGQNALFYRNLFAHSLDGILITNEDGIIQFASPSVKPILGYEADELIGNSAFIYVHTDDQAQAITAFSDEVKEAPKVKFISVRLKKKSNEWLWCVVRGHNLMGISGVNGIVIYFYDDTLRRKAKDALIESEQRFRQQAIVLDNVTDVIVTSDLERKIKSWNKVFEQLTGIPAIEAIGRQFSDVLKVNFTGENREDVFDKVFKTGLWKGEISFQGKNGNPVFLLQSISLIYDEDQKPSGILGVGKDISERKIAEEKLRQSEEEFRHLIHNLRQGVVVQDEHGKVIVCNSAAQSILGLTEEKLIGSSSYEDRWDIIQEDGRKLHGSEHPSQIVFNTKQPVKDVILGYLRGTTGERIWLMVNADPTLDLEGNIVNVVITFSDITEHRRMSKELIEQEIHKQKLLTQATIDGQEKERSEMGKELHDNINQHLNTTRLYLEVAREKATGEVKEMINFSHNALAGIIDKIRLISQSLVPPTLGDIGLVESIQDLCDSLRRTHKFKIDFFRPHFSEDPLPENMKLMLFRITQEQINNIIRHAQANSIKIKLVADAEYIVLTIADDGKGFDPTKYKRGLGFTNIINRASLFDGIVEIDAAKGQGCRLSVTIPLNIAG